MAPASAARPEGIRPGAGWISSKQRAVTLGTGQGSAMDDLDVIVWRGGRAIGCIILHGDGLAARWKSAESKHRVGEARVPFQHNCIRQRKGGEHVVIYNGIGGDAPAQNGIARAG